MLRLSPAFRLLAAATLLAANLLHAQQPAPQRLAGRLTITWGDPRPDSPAAGETLFWLEAPEQASQQDQQGQPGLPPQFAGRNRIRLQLNGQQSRAFSSFGQTVEIVGRAISNTNAAARAADPFVFDVEEFEPRLNSALTTGAALTGTKKVIYLLLKFSDDILVPHPPGFFTNLNNPDTPPVEEVFPATINGFFKKTSYDQFSWLGDVGGVGGVGAAGGWLTLPNSKNFYAPCGWSSSCANLNAIGNDGTALGRAQGIDFKLYDNINFVLSNDLDCCAWGGNYFSSVDSKLYGATWEPPWGQETGTYAHEMGHSLGLPHSGWVYYAYDSPWDMMSSREAAAWVICGSYFSSNDNAIRNLLCDEPGDGYIAAHKDFLAWIPGGNITQITAGSTATVTLEGLALPLGAATKMIRICLNGFTCTGPTARYYTVEARVKNLGATSQFDNGVPGEGIIIQEVRRNRPGISGSCYFNSQSGWALPVDATPGDYDSVACNATGRIYPNYALYNAQWLPGQTYANNSYGFAVNVASRTGSTYVINLTPYKKRIGQTTGE